MQIPNGIGPYRLELNMHDALGQLLIMLTTFSMIAISLLAEHLGHKKWFTLNPFLTLVVIGLVIRMETEIHRMGRFLRFLGDPRELFKAADTVTNLIPSGDVFILLLVLVLTVYSQVQCWQYLRTFHVGYSVSYVAITSSLIVAACYFAVAASQTGKTPFPSREAVELALPR